MTGPTRWERSSWHLALVGSAVVYSWLATGLRSFTLPIDVAVAVPIVLVFVVSWRRSRLGRPAPGTGDRPPWRGVAVWAGFFALLTGWELAAYALSPRQDHPTLSSIFDELTTTHLARAVMFVLWLFVAWEVFVRPRSSSPTSTQ